MEGNNPHGTASSYRSLTISPREFVFSMTIHAGLSLPVEPGEKPGDALARVDEIVKAAVEARLEEAMSFQVTDPKVAGTAERVRAIKEGRPSSQEVLKEAQAQNPAPTAGPSRRVPTAAPTAPATEATPAGTRKVPTRSVA